MNISILKSVGSFCDTLDRLTDLDELYEIITDADSEAAKLHELYKLGVIKKERLHSAFFSCSFDKYKKVEEISDAEYTPLLCFDFDKIDSSLFSYIYEILEEDQYTRLIFKSPSGNGIKLIVEAKSSLKDHEGVYNTLVYYYEELTGVEVDSSCKNINRACFLAYAPDAVYKEDSVIYELPKLVKIPQKIDASKIKDLETKETEEALALARRWVEDKGVKFLEGKRNIYIYRFACNCNRLGISPEAVIEYIKTNYSGDAEFKEVVNKCYKLNKAQYKQNAYKAKKEDIPVIIPATKNDEEFYKEHPFYTSDKNLTHFISIHKNALPIIRQGGSLEDFKAFINKELKINDDKIITDYYNWHSFIYGTIYQKSEHKFVILKDSQTICDSFAKEHLTPRYNEISRIYEYRDFISGKFETFTKQDSKNTIEKLLKDFYLLKGIDAERSIRLRQIARYNPFLEYLKEHEPDSSEDDITYLVSVFSDHNRFYQYNEKPEKEREALINNDLVYNIKAVVVWQVFCIWQALGYRVNEMALGAVSKKGGTGKSAFMKRLRLPFIELGIASTNTTYDMHSPDGIRPMISKVILHDDELHKRSQKDIKAFKEALSVNELSYTEKYESQITDARRICSYTFCTNDTEFLQEDSRRDFILKFAEDIEADFDLLFDEELEQNKDKLNKSWGYAYRLAMDKEESKRIMKWYRQLVTAAQVRNKEFRSTTTAKDLLPNLFRLPLEDPAKTIHYKSFRFNMNLDDDRRKHLNAYDIFTNVINTNGASCNYIITTAEIQAILKANYNITIHYADIKKHMQELGFILGAYRIDGKIYKGYKLTSSENIEMIKREEDYKKAQEILAAKANKAETGGAAANITYVSDDSDEVPF